MMIDDDIEFMFYTRTLSEDYRVFSGDGNETLDYAEDFAPIMELSNLESDDERSAVVFSDGGNIYVSAFGLMRGAKDRARRDIRFSFCVILPESKRAAAMKIFSRVKDEWNETGSAAGSLIKEIPVTRKDWKGRDVKGENVRFDSQRFIQWLVNNDTKIAPPKAGYMLKYFADTGELKPIRIGKVGKDEEDMSGLRRNSNVQQERRRSPRILLAVSAILLFVVCVGLGIRCFTLQKELNEASTRANHAEEISKDLQKEISGLKERLATVQESLNITSSSLDKANQEIEKLKKENENLRNTPPKSGGGNQSTQKKTEEITSPDVPSPQKPVSSGGCTGGVVSAGILPLVYLASQDKGHSTSQDISNNDNEEAMNGGHNSLNNNDSGPVEDAQKADNGGTSSEGSISQDQRGNDAIRSNDRNGNNENQGGDDTRE